MFKRRLLLLALVIACGVFASFFGGAARTLFYISLLVPLLSVLYTFYVYLRFRIFQDAENKIIVKGEKTPYFFVLSDEDFIAYTDIRVEFLEDFSTPQNMALCCSYCLIPGEKNEYRTEVLCRYRGEYSIGVKTVVVTDLLGILRIRYPAPSTISMTVLPKITEVERLTLAPLDEDAKLLRFSHTVGEEPPDCDIRKFVVGDSLRRVNWKVSAKKWELFVRQSSEPHNNAIVFVMDMTQIRTDHYTRIVTEDKIIESALTTADYLVRKRVPLTMLYEQDGPQQERIDTPGQLKAFYRRCAGMQFYAQQSPWQLLALRPASAYSGGFVIFAVSAVTAGLYEACEQLLRLGSDVAVLFFGDDGAAYAGAFDARVIYLPIALADEVADRLGGCDEH